MEHLLYLSEGATAGLFVLAVLIFISILVYVERRKGKI